MCDGLSLLDVGFLEALVVLGTRLEAPSRSSTSVAHGPSDRLRGCRAEVINDLLAIVDIEDVVSKRWLSVVGVPVEVRSSKALSRLAVMSNEETPAVDLETNRGRERR